MGKINIVPLSIHQHLKGKFSFLKGRKVHDWIVVCNQIRVLQVLKIGCIETDALVMRTIKFSREDTADRDSSKALTR